MKEIVFVTGNIGKQKSLEKKVKGSDILVTCCDLGFIEPTVNDIRYIAEQKVRYAYDILQKPCIAMDAGFIIEAFPGRSNFPGAFPKRDLLEPIGIDGLLEMMKQVENRSCYFEECVAYYDGVEVKFFEGQAKGSLSKEKKGMDTLEKWSDLWYVFIPQNETKTLAQMTSYEREHRNREEDKDALKEFAKWFQTLEKEKVLKKSLTRKNLFRKL